MTPETNTPSGKFQVPYDLMEAQQRIERLDQYQMKGGGIISIDRSHTMAMGDHYPFRLTVAGRIPFVEAWIEGSVTEESDNQCMVQIKQSLAFGDWLQGIVGVMMLCLVGSGAAVIFYDASLSQVFMGWVLAAVIIGLYAFVLVGNVRQQQELTRNFMLNMTSKDPNTIRDIIQ
jgi:hypothetical protein